MASRSEEKIPLHIARKLPYRTLARMINKAKKYLLTDPTWQKVCEEYSEEPDIIDLIPTMFGDLKVSAKTDHGVVILNYQLLTDGDFFKDYSYLIHEYTHWFQRCYGKEATQSSNDGDYLDNPFEQEGFSNQVKYIADQFGEPEAEKYVDNLLEHHQVEDEDEVKKKKEVLMSRV